MAVDRGGASLPYAPTMLGFARDSALMGRVAPTSARRLDAGGRGAGGGVVWMGVARTGQQAEVVVAKVDLEFLARQMERMINDLAGLKDDVMVLTARVERLDATVHSLVVEVRAMHSRHERLVRRVDRLEEQGSGGG